MKRGVFFTLLAVILSGLFIGSFTFYIRYSQSRQMDSVETRINSMNELVRSVETDFQRALYISSFRALLSLADHISLTGEYLSDTQEDFQRMVLNGTVGSSSTVEPLMQNQTLPNWSNKIETLARQLDVLLDIDIVNVTLSHTDTWNLQVEAFVNVSLTDNRMTAAWQRETTLTATIGVEGFEDPVYLIGSNGKIVRTITRTNISSWNITALQQHFQQRTYDAKSSAPSFLQRLEGDLSASPYGIETLIDANELEIYGEEVLNRSSVDYIYYGSQSTTDYYVHNITDEGNPYFQLDSSHVTHYNVGEYNYTG